MHVRTPTLSLTAAIAAAFATGSTAHAAGDDAPSASPAAVIAVSNCNDSGPGSLRAAIDAAATGDTVDMRSLECRRLVLTSGPLRFWHRDLTILGPTRAFVIDGNESSRVFKHLGTGTLRLRAMSIANGYHEGREVYGGCIDSAGDLRLEYVRVHDCTLWDRGWPSGGGGLSAQNVELYDSEVFDNYAINGDDDMYPVGGGIFAWGHVTLVRSKVNNNRAQGGQGGGINANGGLYARYSEISGNYGRYCGAMCVGGGDITILHSLIANNDVYSSFGAGSLSASGPDHSILIANTTVSGNTASQHSGLSMQVGNGAQMSLVNSTIAFNEEVGITDRCSGGLTISGLLHLESTIVAKNWCGGGHADITDDYDGITEPGEIVGSDNLVILSTVPLPSDTISANPRISPLADNGGRTFTHALWAGSPAVDMGSNNAGFTYDQRGPGFDRVKGGRTDIGAYER